MFLARRVSRHAIARLFEITSTCPPLGQLPRNVKLLHQSNVEFHQESGPPINPLFLGKETMLNREAAPPPLASRREHDSRIESWDDAISRSSKQVLKILARDPAKNPQLGSQLLDALFNRSIVIRQPPSIVNAITRAVLGRYRAGGIPQDMLEILIQLVALNLPLSDDRTALDLIYPAILVYLRATPPPGATKRPPHIFTNLLNLLLRLIPTSPERCLEIFQILVDRRFIPQSILRDRDLSSGTVHTLIYASFIRTCCFYRFGNLASSFLDDFLSSGEANIPILPNLIQEVIALRLASPRRRDVRYVDGFIRKHYITHPIPTQVLANTLVAAKEWDMGKEAVSIYSLVGDHLKESDPFPIPGSIVYWLATQLNRYSSRHRLKNFLYDAAHQDIIIPFLDQAPLVEFVAQNSFTNLTFNLWRQISEGPQGDVLRGSPTVMLEIIKLFKAFIDNTEKESTVLLDPLSSEQFKATQERLQEAQGFVDFVMKSYQTQIQPLAFASHLAITTLARAYFIMGNDQMAFDCLQRLKQKGVAFSAVDFHVILNSISESDPRGGLDFLLSTPRGRTKPDVRSFTIVMVHAMRHGTLDILLQAARLLKERCRKARESVSMVDHLARAVLERRFTDDTEQMALVLKALIDVLYIIDYPRDLLADRSDIGVALIDGSLPDHPRCAFEFWRIFLRNVVPWDDVMHKRWRSRIVSCIADSVEIGDKEKEEIWSQLRDSTGKLS